MMIILKILLLAVFISVALSLYTYSFFWYENAGSPGRSGSKSGIPLPELMVRGIFTGIASLLFIFFVYPLGFIPHFRKPAEISPSQPIIIFVHGLYHNASAWLLIRKWLRKEGFTNLFAMNYTSFFTSFDKALAKLESFIARTRAAVPGQPVILVGHSMGGLLARVYAETSSAETAPASVITLGTPHRGSKIAAFATGGLGRSLIYQGPLFERIEIKELRMPCRAVSLISPADSMVLPYESLKAPYPGWEEYETIPMSHVSMVFSRDICRKIIELIRQ